MQRKKIKKPLAPCKKRDRSIDSTPSLLQYFNRTSCTHTDAFKKAMQTRDTSAKKAKIGVTYREDGYGAGALFDHCTIQLATDTPTAMLNVAQHTRGFDKAIREAQNLLKYGTKIDNTHFIFPPLHTHNDPEIGLVVIPGVSEKSSKTADFKLRKAQETEIIHEALRRGQPVLGICGGSWTLYEYFGGKTRKVEGHNYRGGMPRLGNHSKPTHNKDMHRLTLADESRILHAAFGINDKQAQNIAVNSVHPKAPDENHIPDQVFISAIAAADATLTPSNCKPTETSIEAFETLHGVPVLGIQWHPEAYGSDTIHAKMLKYLAKAGQRYTNHRHVLAEFSEQFDEVKANLKPQKKFTNTLACHKRAYRDKTIFVQREGKPYENSRHVDELKHEIRVKEDCLEVMQARKRRPSAK